MSNTKKFSATFQTVAAADAFVKEVGEKISTSGSLSHVKVEPGHTENVVLNLGPDGIPAVFAEDLHNLCKNNAIKCHF